MYKILMWIFVIYLKAKVGKSHFNSKPLLKIVFFYFGLRRPREAVWGRVWLMTFGMQVQNNYALLSRTTGPGAAHLAPAADFLSSFNIETMSKAYYNLQYKVLKEILLRWSQKYL